MSNHTSHIIREKTLIPQEPLAVDVYRNLTMPFATSVRDGYLRKEDFVIFSTPPELPVATGTDLGGVMIGARLTMNNGVLSADVQVQNYQLPTATRGTPAANGNPAVDAVLGGIKIGDGFNIAGDGTLSVNGAGIDSLAWHRTGDVLSEASIFGDTGATGYDIAFKTANVIRMTVKAATATNGSNIIFNDDISVKGVLIGRGRGTNYNLVFGDNALQNVTTGRDNIVIGTGAANGLTTGSHNIRLGNYAGTILGDVNSTIVIQTGINSPGQDSVWTRVIMNQSGSWGFGAQLFSDLDAKLRVQNNDATHAIQNWIALDGRKVAEISDDGLLNLNDIRIRDAALIGGVITCTDLLGNSTWRALPTASDTIAGMIKIGARLTITDGVLSADAQTTTGGTTDTLAWHQAGDTITTDAIFGQTNSGTNVARTIDFKIANATRMKLPAVVVQNVAAEFTNDIKIQGIYIGNASADPTGTNQRFGFNSLMSVTGGAYNTATGPFSLTNLTTGSNNTGTGLNSLFALTVGSDNTATGAYSLNNATTGTKNSGTGRDSLANLTTGSSNTGNGAGSLLLLTTGNYNTVAGTLAGSGITGGSGNLMLGANAGGQAGDVSNTIILQAGGTATTTSPQHRLTMNSVGHWGFGVDLATDIIAKLQVQNFDATKDIQLWLSADGTIAGRMNNAGKLDVVNLRVSGGNPVEGQVLTAVGTDGTCIWANGGSGSGGWLVGGQSLTGVSVFGQTNTPAHTIEFKSGNANRMIMPAAMVNNVGVTFNYDISANGVAIGRSSGTGANIVRVGASTMLAITSGYNDTAIGALSLSAITTGADNAAFGAMSLQRLTTGSGNIANGTEVLAFVVGGSCNVGAGHRALYNLTSGNMNTVNGFRAAPNLITGTGNLLLGAHAGYDLGDTSNTIVLQGGGGDLLNPDTRQNTAYRRMMMDSNGNWGIGVNQFTDIVSKLHVRNNSPTKAIQSWLNTAGTRVAYVDDTGLLATTVLRVSGTTAPTAGMVLTAIDTDGTCQWQTPGTFAGSWLVGGQTLAANSIFGQTDAAAKTIDFKIANNTRMSMPAAIVQNIGIEFVNDIKANGIYIGSGGTNVSSGNQRVGFNSLLAVTNGLNNTANGTNSLPSLTIGNNNTANGTNSLPSLTIGNSNTANGTNSLRTLTTGNYNTAIGDNSGFGLMAGLRNIRIGPYSGTGLGDTNDTIVIQAGQSTPTEQFPSTRMMMDGSGKWGLGIDQFANINAKLHVRNAPGFYDILRIDNVDGAEMFKVRSDGGTVINTLNGGSSAALKLTGSMNTGAANFGIQVSTDLASTDGGYFSAFTFDGVFRYNSANINQWASVYKSNHRLYIPAGTTVPKFSCFMAGWLAAGNQITGGGTLQRYYAFYDTGGNYGAQNYGAYFANSVGIGTDDPAQKLHVAGNILATGAITPGSDIRFKKDIVPIKEGLKEVMDMKPVTYQKRYDITSDEYDGFEAGFVANDFKDVIPYLVESHGEDNLLSLNYNGVIAVLVKAMQEQQVQIEQLKTSLGEKMDS